MSSILVVAAAVLTACVLAAGVTAAAQAVALQLHRSRLKHLIEEAEPQSPLAALLMQEPWQVLPVLASISTAAAIGAVSVALVVSFQVVEYSTTSAALLLLAATLVLLLVQSIGRVIATRWPEGTARALIRATSILGVLLAPAVLPFVLLERGLLALLGGGNKPNGHSEAEEELRAIVEDEEGDLEQDERQMILGIVEMGHRTARELMVPRIDMVAVEKSAHVSDVLDLVVSTGHSRIPVYDQNVDNIIGIVYAKDLLRHLRQGKLDDVVGPLVRPAYFVPESKRTDELLRELQQKKVHMAIVVDEYGGTAGLITIEDLLEEIVGEIQDEYDIEEEAAIQKLSETEAILDARVSIHDVNESLDLELADEQSDTIGGLVYERLGKVPVPGDRVVVDGATFEVLSTSGRRIRKIKVSVQRTEDHSANGNHQHRT